MRGDERLLDVPLPVADAVCFQAAGALHGAPELDNQSVNSAQRPHTSNPYATKVDP
jgi:hypothetical protein